MVYACSSLRFLDKMLVICRHVLISWRILGLLFDIILIAQLLAFFAYWSQVFSRVPIVDGWLLTQWNSYFLALEPCGVYWNWWSVCNRRGCVEIQFGILGTHIASIFSQIGFGLLVICGNDIIVQWMRVKDNIWCWQRYLAAICVQGWCGENIFVGICQLFFLCCVECLVVYLSSAWFSRDWAFVISAQSVFYLRHRFLVLIAYIYQNCLAFLAFS